MFYYLFKEYKKGVFYIEDRDKNIFKRAIKAISKLNCIERWLIIALIASAAFIPIINYTQKLDLKYFGFTVIPVLAVLVFVAVYKERCSGVHHDEFLENHKERYIDALEVILKRKEYNLFSVAGINSTIDYCERKLNIKTFTSLSTTLNTFFIKIIIPIILLIMGVVIGAMDKDEILLYSVEIMKWLLIFCGLWMMLEPLFEKLFYPNKYYYECFREDLEYIKTQIFYNENIE